MANNARSGTTGRNVSLPVIRGRVRPNALRVDNRRPVHPVNARPTARSIGAVGVVAETTPLHVTAAVAVATVVVAAEADPVAVAVDVPADRSRH